MFEFLALIIALVGGTICGLYDLKTTNMLDWLAVLMIISGFVLAGAESFVSGSLAPLLFSFSVAGAFFIFGFFMYKAGYWGGGDGELLIALGALVPVNPFISVSFGIYGFVFALNFLINSFIIGGIYSILYAVVIAMHDKKVRTTFYKRIKDVRFLLALTFLVFLAVGLSVSYFLPFYIYFSLLLVVLLPVLYVFAKTVEEVGFNKKIHVSKLKVDDVIGEDLPELNIFKKEIRGLTQEEVRKIKKNRKYVIVRDGVRYSPVFVISLAFTLIFGGFLL